MAEERADRQGARIDDPELFLAMDDLELVAHGVVEGALHGMHRSPYIGFSVEFDAHREYQHGDDLRYVNWNLWARTDRLYIKQFKSDTDLNLYILLDTSRSMLCKHGAYPKWAYGARAAAALAYLALHNRDAAGVFLLGERIRNHVPPRVRPDQFHEILALLEDADVSGGTSLAHSLEETIHLCRRRGIVVLISDLFDEEERVLRGLNDLRHYGHEVVVVNVLDAWEAELPPHGQYEFHDLESGEVLQTNAAEVRRGATEAVKAWRNRLRQRCVESGIDWLECTTDTPLSQFLVDYLLRRTEGEGI
ncbi:MAG: DUF58 domain-containing protein [Lentisphaeria bacterium]|nr:DUF58 domain-containing protein [Lentisphaeria bacterium]